jgi:hypothetical protein
MVENLNKHAQSIGSDKFIVSASHETKITDEQRRVGLCSKGCGKTATHLANFCAREKLLCDEHAEICKWKNANLPPDMWFCKRMNPQKLF